MVLLGVFILLPNLIPPFQPLKNSDAYSDSLSQVALSLSRASNTLGTFMVATQNLTFTSLYSNAHCLIRKYIIMQVSCVGSDPHSVLRCIHIARESQRRDVLKVVPSIICEVILALLLIAVCTLMCLATARSYFLLFISFSISKRTADFYRPLKQMRRPKKAA